MDDLQWLLVDAARTCPKVFVIRWQTLPLFERVAVWWALKGLERRKIFERSWSYRVDGNSISIVRGYAVAVPWSLKDGEVFAKR